MGMEVLLERVRHTEPLYELKPEERKQELAGCFAMLPHAKVSGKHVLLCDDIYTTGSTFAEAAQVLLDAGRRVYRRWRCARRRLTGSDFLLMQKLKNYWRRELFCA